MDSNYAKFMATPLEQMLETASPKRKITIGLPAAQGTDRRFPLTPEAAGMLVERGYTMKIESGAAASIRYTDYRYQQQGVEIVTRHDALRCDIVLCLSPLSTIDARMLKRGSMLLSLYDSIIADAAVLAILVRDHVISIALDQVADDNGHMPYADILAEVAGRAAMSVATSVMADGTYGKGILLGGVSGIVPCEVTIIGSGIDARAAARSALGLGAMVRMFDNDVYRLRSAQLELGAGVFGSVMHLHVLLNALRSADVVIATDIKPVHVISAEAVREMKQGVVCFDLGSSLHPVFPSMPCYDLGSVPAAQALSTGGRVCFSNPGGAVPRTTAMAISNTFITMISEMFTCDGFTNALMLNPGLQRAVLTFLGKPVNAVVAGMLGMRQVDLKLILQFS